MSVTPAYVSSAFTALQGAISTAGTLQGATAAALVPVVNAAIALQQAVTAAITATDALINTSPTSLASGAQPTNATAYLVAQINAVLTMANVLQIQGYANRVALNLNALL